VKYFGLGEMKYVGNVGHYIMKNLQPNETLL